MIFLDTNVLVYALGAEEHPLARPCRSLVAAVAAGEREATTLVEVVQEFAHVWARRRPRQQAVSRARDYAALLAPLTSTGQADLDAGLVLFESVDRLDAFDAVLAATALRTGAGAVVSADRRFAGVPGLVHVDPGSPRFDEELAVLG